MIWIRKLGLDINRAILDGNGEREHTSSRPANENRMIDQRARVKVISSKRKRNKMFACFEMAELTGC